MKCVGLVLITAITVSQCLQSESNDTQSAQDFIRGKRHDPFWVWGNVPGNNHVRPNLGQRNWRQPNSGQPFIKQPNWGHSNWGQPNYGQPNWGQINSDQQNWGQLVSGQLNSGQQNRKQFKTDWSNWGQLKSEQLNSGQQKWGQLKSGQLNLGQQNWKQLNADRPNWGQLNSGQQNWKQLNTDRPNWGQLNSGQLDLGQQNWGHLNSGQLNLDQQNRKRLNTDRLNSGQLSTGQQNIGQLNLGHADSGRPTWGQLDSTQLSAFQSSTVQTSTVQSSTIQTSTNTPATTEEPNPCDPYVVQKPDFRRPGRRISEAKCFEYIWEMKNREDNNTHEADCERWRKRFFGRTLIIKGRDAEPGEFPHMGALGWRTFEGTWNFKCGSSLISSKFLITAGHCSRVSRNDITVASPIPEVVRLGDKNILDVVPNVQNRVDARISRIIVHPLYAPPKKYFDIALVELAERVVFTKYLQPACLWHAADTRPLGTRGTVTGWGYTDTARTTLSPELQAAVVDIIDQNQCDRLLRRSWTRLFNGLQPHQICAGKLAGGVDTCQGDSGGPLQVKISVPIKTQGNIHNLVGVTSFGIGCANANTPGVYTRISSFVDWIENIVWPGQ